MTSRVENYFRTTCEEDQKGDEWQMGQIQQLPEFLGFTEVLLTDSSSSDETTALLLQIKYHLSTRHEVKYLIKCQWKNYYLRVHKL